MSALVIANTQIRQDVGGRYCLNDLHQASGGAKRHQPANWLRLEQTRELVAEIEKPVAVDEGLLRSEEAPVHQINDGFANGTYVVKELVYAYAMWISAAFHLHVIRAYDALVIGKPAELPVLPPSASHRADVLVSAGRIFGSALRTARHLRMPPDAAMRAAFACARRHTGIDWAEELDFTPPAIAQAPVDPLRAVVAEHLAGIECFEMADLIRRLDLCAVSGTSTTSVMKRVGVIARSLGWRSHRYQDMDRVFHTVWRPFA